MRIVVINEISAADKILTSWRRLQVGDMGTQPVHGNAGDMPALLYIHTGLMSALLLHLGIVDFVIGGCGTSWVTS